MTVQDFIVNNDHVRVDALRVGDYIVERDVVRLVTSVAFAYDPETGLPDDQLVVLNDRRDPVPVNTVVTRITVRRRA